MYDGRQFTALAQILGMRREELGLESQQERKAGIDSLKETCLQPCFQYL